MKTKKIANIISKIFTVLSWLLIMVMLFLTLAFFTRHSWIPVIQPNIEAGEVTSTLIMGDVIGSSSLGDSLDIIPILNSGKIFSVTLLSVFASFVIYRLLRRLFKNVVDNQTFSKENLYIIYALGVAQIIGDFFSNLSETFSSTILASQLQAQGFEISTTPSYLINLTPGLMVLLIGLFFSQAVKLQEEQALTI